MKNYLIALAVVVLLANAALAKLFNPPAVVEYKFPSGRYSIIVNNEPNCRILLKERTKGAARVLFAENYSCDTRVYPSPNRKNLILEIRGNSTDIILCVFKADQGRPQLIDCICPSRCNGSLRALYAAFPEYKTKKNLLEKALTGYPRDVAYAHKYCAFVKWVDNERAVLNVTMYTPAQKYYELNNRKILAGIDKDYVYTVANL
jgi:hypothetical protein